MYICTYTITTHARTAGILVQRDLNNAFLERRSKKCTVYIFYILIVSAITILLYVDLQKSNKPWQWYIAYWTEGPKTLRRGERKIIDLNSVEVQLLLRIISVSFFLSFFLAHLFTHTCIRYHIHSLSLFSLAFVSPCFFPFSSNSYSLIIIMYFSEIDSILCFSVVSLPSQ